MDLSLLDIEHHLSNPATLNREHDVLSPAGFRAAAVIAPLVERDGDIHLIFNKRAADLEVHAGQVSFPGGRRDGGDMSLLATAQRELAEELSIGHTQHRPLCRLSARAVISHYFVTPFVSLIDSQAQIIPDPGEVAYAFEVPLAYLMDPQTVKEGQREIFGIARTFYTWTYEGEVIWGATGRIIADLLIALGAKHLKP